MGWCASVIVWQLSTYCYPRTAGRWAVFSEAGGVRRLRVPGTGSIFRVREELIHLLFSYFTYCIKLIHGACLHKNPPSGIIIGTAGFTVSDYLKINFPRLGGAAFLPAAERRHIKPAAQLHHHPLNPHAAGHLKTPARRKGAYFTWKNAFWQIPFSVRFPKFPGRCLFYPERPCSGPVPVPLPFPSTRRRGPVFRCGRSR